MKKKTYDQRLIEPHIIPMPKKSLQRKISKKLDQLHELIDKISEVQVINSNDPDTWDSDTLYNLIEDLKEALQLLEDKKTKPFNLSLTGGEETVTETGLCSLVDEYQEEESEEDD